MTQKFGVNLAIGPSCFVRCRGCYNFFGNSDRRGNLVSALEILDFVCAANELGVNKITLSGGDPLTHPEIIEMIHGIAGLGLSVKLDTVGTAFLDDARKIFYGRGEIKRVAINDIASYVAIVGLPLDGSQDSTIQAFRSGRPELVNETRRSAALLRDAGVGVCVNTVAHRLNIHEIMAVRSLVIEMDAQEWQVFEFQPIGPLGSRNAEILELEEGEFEELTRSILNSVPQGPVQIECKSRRNRENLYFMVDDSGLAWIPGSSGTARTIIGHITHERDAVMRSLGQHLQRMSVDHHRLSSAVVYPSPFCKFLRGPEIARLQSRVSTRGSQTTRAQFSRRPHQYYDNLILPLQV